MNAPDADAPLIERVKQGDVRAFEMLVVKYQRRIERLIGRMVRDVDLVRWYFGEPTEVYARVIGSDKHAGLDYALATLTVPGGPICHLHGSWAEPEGFSQSAEVCGTDGMLSYDSRGRDEFSFLAHATSDEATALPPPPPGEQDPFGRQLADFARAIRG